MERIWKLYVGGADNNKMRVKQAATLEKTKTKQRPRMIIVVRNTPTIKPVCDCACCKLPALTRSVHLTAAAGVEEQRTLSPVTVLLS